MPRPNQPRTIAGERALARRVAHLREASGMSYEGLAVQMKHRGCPINASALYRVEKGDPPRRITVDELMAFSQVFNLPVENLLLPPEVAGRQELVDLLVTWEESRVVAQDSQEKLGEALAAVREYVERNPDVEPVLEEAMSVWAAEYFDEERHPGAVAYQMWHFTKSERWSDRLREETGAD